MTESAARLIRIPRAEVPPGQMRRVEAPDGRILLANVEGTFYAVDDLCTHEDASLSTGRLEGDRVKCPLHGSRFCLRTGEPQEEPADEALRCYPVRLEGEQLIIDLEPA